jgi:hypothetical protein
VRGPVKRGVSAWSCEERCQCVVLCFHASCLQIGYWWELVPNRLCSIFLYNDMKNGTGKDKHGTRERAGRGRCACKTLGKIVAGNKHVCVCVCVCLCISCIFVDSFSVEVSKRFRVNLRKILLE